MEWNCNGLLQHQHQQELQEVLDIANIDICLISETHFTTESFIKFQGYNLYHTIHPDNVKHEKPPTEVSSFRLISLLPVISKLFEKVLLKHMKPIIEENNLIPFHQFGFREKHSTTD